MADGKESYLWELRSFKKGQRIICTPQIIFVTIIIIIFAQAKSSDLVFEDVDEDLDQELAQLSLGRYTLYTYKFYGIF